MVQHCQFPATLFLIPIILAGCVPAKKYQALNIAREQSEIEVQRLQKIEQTYQGLQGDYQQLQKDYEENGQALRELVVKYDRLNETYHVLLEQYDQAIDEKQRLIQNSSQEMNRLREVIQEKDHIIEQKQREIWDKEMELENRDSRLAHLTEAMEPRDLQAKSLLEAWDAQQMQADSIRAVVARALENDSTGITLRSESGKVTVNLPQSGLFSPGTNQLAKSGQSILQTLVNALQSASEWDVLVEGHTSRQGAESFNWDLSMTWATEVVKEMIRDGMQPARLTACGRSYYEPLYSDDSPESALKNRRIAIVVRPANDINRQQSGQ
ncbi:MAG: OmpA family protein [Saprospiraceae bacterium]|nr:OmpA family protein [Saprospiraceae bacterium]